MEQKGKALKKARKAVPAYRAFLWRHSGLIVVLVLVSLVFLAALAVFLFERRTNPEINRYNDALWLTVVTMATVGYGDKVPVTAGGKIVAMGAMIFGIGILGAFLSQKASQSFKKAGRRMKGLDVKVRGHNLLLVCGWNSRGPFVLSRLRHILDEEWGGIVILCDADEKPVEDEGILFVKGNQAKEDDLKRAKVEKVKTAILLADQKAGSNSEETDASTVLTALSVHAMNPETTIIAEASQPENVPHLKLAGASLVLNTDLLIGEMLARSTVQSKRIRIISEMASGGTEELFKIMEVVPEMVDMELDRLFNYVKEQQGAVPVAVMEEDKLVPFDDKYEPSEGDQIVAVRVFYQ